LYESKKVQMKKSLTLKGDERKSPAGRKSIFKNDEKGRIFSVLLPESQYDTITNLVRTLRSVHLKTLKP